MAVEVIDTLKPKNNGTFPVVEAEDVEVSEGVRLPEALGQKAEQADLDEAATSLQGQIDQIVISASAESVVAPEVAQARVGTDDTEYATLKSRLDAENSILSDATKNLQAELELLAANQELLAFGDTISGTAQKRIEKEIPRGTYNLKIDQIISSDTDKSKSRIYFFDSNDSQVTVLTLERNVAIDMSVELGSDVATMMFYAASDAQTSLGDTFEYRNVQISAKTGLSNRLDGIENNVAKFTAQIDSVADSVSALVDSKEIISVDKFEHGNIGPTGGNSDFRAAARMRSKSIESAIYDYTIKISGGFYSLIAYYSSDDISDFENVTSWEQNETYTIHKGDHYRLLVTESTSSETEKSIADILSHVSVETSFDELDERVTALENGSSGSVYSRNNDANSAITAGNKHFYESGTEKNYSGLFTIAHISDIHTDSARYQNFIDYINANNNIDASICTGDFVIDASNSYEFDFIALDSGNVLHVVGNHDKGGITTAAVKSKLMPSESATYYYKDYDDIRIIVLDQCLDGGTGGTLGYYGSEQIEWLLDVLDESTDKHVIIAMHTVENKPVPVAGNSAFYQRYYRNDAATGEASGSANGDTIIQNIINAFSNGTTLNKTYTFRNGDVISVNHTFSGGVFIGYFVGHLHADFIGVDSLYNNQMYYGVTCGACVPDYAPTSNYGESYSDLTRIPSDKSEDAFNVYVIDTISRLVKVVRVGSDRNDILQDRKYAVYTY
jgi:hypothetical protein